jgi:gamma-glutamylcysteine synthetase
VDTQSNKSASKAHARAAKSTSRKELEVSFVGVGMDPQWCCNRTETELANCNGDVTK